MTQSHPNGMPCWTDLCTPDIEAAKTFYEGLFGWTYGPTQEDMGGYTICYVDGKAVAGLMHMMPGMETPVWTLYFASDDIHKTQQAVSDNGGAVIAPAMDVSGLGSMLVVADPTGAVFGAWQAGTFVGGELFSQPGAMAWEDLRSHDAATARSFYTSVFGFRHDDPPMPVPADYKVFTYADGDRPLGGMGDMMGAPEGVPSHWALYFNVEDTPAAQEFVKSSGGAVAMEWMQTPFGRQAMIVDPFGGAFNIIDTYGATGM